MQPDDPGATDAADFDDTFRESYWPMVRSLAVACGDRVVAEDAVQDAFQRAFVRWRRIASYDDPVGWIRHVALNRIRDHHRHDTRKHKAVARLATEAATTVPPPRSLAMSMRSSHNSRSSSGSRRRCSTWKT